VSVWLFSGINGSGKTLNAIKLVDTDPKFAMFDESGKEVARRPVYYFGINECKLPWIELDEDGVKNWMALPSGSVVFIDECWRVFPSRQGSQKPPHYVEELAEHRKLGLDFIVISQRGIGQIDAFLRGLVERHLHFERIFGTNTFRCLAWEKCCDNVNDYHMRREASHSTARYDKKYFDAYKSAELHTIKARLPWGKIALVCSLPIAFLVLAYFAWSAISGFTGSSSSDSGIDAGLLSAVSSSLPVVSASAPADWAAAQIPRVTSMPWTAPQYDELMKPKSVPLPVGCLLEEKSGRCQCGSWQGTPVDTSPDLCRQIALHGFFDPTLERPDLDEFRDGRKLSSGRRLSGESRRTGGGVSRFIPIDGDVDAPGAGGGDDVGPVVVNAGGGFVGGGGGGAGGGGSPGGGSGSADYGAMRSPFSRR